MDGYVGNDPPPAYIQPPPFPASLPLVFRETVEAEAAKPQDIQIRVTGWKTVSQNGDDFELYTLHINDGVFEWEQLKRYSDCFTLHEILEKKNAKLPSFPPRMMKLFMDQNDRNERSKKLDAYFQELSTNTVITKGDEIKSFVGLDGTINKRPILKDNRTRLSPPEEIRLSIQRVKEQER